MRAIRLTSLVVLALLASTSSGSAIGRPARKIHLVHAPPVAARRADAQAQAAGKNLSWTAKGWGETQADAEENALKNAQEEVLKQLARHKQRLEWEPSLDYIKTNLVKKEAVATKDFGDGVGVLQGVSLEIELSPANLQYILREDRQVRSESRMLLLGKVLAGLVALLGAVAGYLRLEEMTKGYYTAWLRLAALGFVTAVGAGIWWIS